jgi:hypothetical protein
MAHSPGDLVTNSNEYNDLFSNHKNQVGIVTPATHNRRGNPLSEGYVMVQWSDGRCWVEWEDNLTLFNAS